ncbi:YceI family protein [Phenylobacterium terrae]|uniref:YceI family protein n=1 Tax=Phenylobacterium terrae TaxID=2665495 RepID=A0ABW4N9M1_9CAUL
MRRTLALFAAAALVGCGQPAEQAPKSTEAPSAPAAEPAPVTAPAGAYTLDKGHTSVTFKVNHMGVSNYTARFTDIDAQMQFDPENPERTSVTATIDPASIETDYPDPKTDFDALLRGKDFLAADQFPPMTFRSTKVERTGPRTARVTGDLSFRGVTRPVVLETTFNGGYPAGGMDPTGARIGFSAKGALKRSDFGMKTGLPAPGSQMGVGDLVEVIIEAEFIQPAPAAPAPAAS